MKKLLIKKSPFVFLTATLTALVLVSSAANADTSWMKKVKPFKNGPHPKLKPTKLEYEFSWKGTVKAGTVTFDFNKKDKRYKGLDISQAYGRSQGVAYGLFPYHFSMTSFAKASTHKPLIFVADEKDKRDKVKTTNTFKPNGVIHSSTKTNYRTNKVRKRDVFTQYGEQATKVLNALLDKYIEQGVESIETVDVIKVAPISDIGSTRQIMKEFGGRAQYDEAIEMLEKQLYS